MSLEHLFLERIRSAETTARKGQVRRIMPTFIEADGPSVPLGALCRIETRRASARRDTEATLATVVGVNGDSVILAPFEDGPATFPGAWVTAQEASDAVGVGDAFLGRAVDALGRPIDGGPPIRPDRFGALGGYVTGPLDRTSRGRIVETGIRAIDGLLTLGQGQRVGVFAAAGVGKTTLLSQLVRQAQADRCVICLVGERGREVEAMWSRSISPEAKARTTLVAATSDQAAAMRTRAGQFALNLAEHWRSEGHHVLFLLDSVTRLAMALREVGLAAGEPPTVRAYTPGVFAAIPKLVERCGALKSGGAITAVMTVLSETDDVDDPISEMMKSLLDGHIILSRELAESAHYPAIDVPASISRLAGDLMTRPQRLAAQKVVRLLSTYENSKTMIEAGVYVKGSSAEIDSAIDQRPALLDFLRQESDEHSARADTQALLERSWGRP